MSLLRSHGPGVNEDGHAHLEQAVRLDPRSGLALAYLALAKVILANYREPDVLASAREFAVRAVALAPADHRTHRILGLIRMFQREHSAAQGHLQRALQLNPYDADTLVQFGYLRVMRGYPDEGLGLIERGMRLNPLHPDWYHVDRAVALFAVGRYRESADVMGLASVRRPSYVARQAAAAAMAGDLEQA
ncbi:hypothetical protein WDZ92_49485, partial [Nostoc sp. NIES-2111]